MMTDLQVLALGLDSLRWLERHATLAVSTDETARCVPCLTWAAVAIQGIDMADTGQLRCQSARERLALVHQAYQLVDYILPGENKP